MRPPYDGINQVLPHGELIRVFANQSSVSTAELKRVLRSRGVFFSNNEKESIVPTLANVLLSPNEFQILRECQNTREDNLKKSTSRLKIQGDPTLIDILPDVNELAKHIDNDYTNYKLTEPPAIVAIGNDPNKVLVSFEVERYTMDKSWYELKNRFKGSLMIEKVPGSEVLIIKSYTSSESEEVANKFENAIVGQIKFAGFADKDTVLQKIRFADFSNEERISFFFQLTWKMNSVYVTFKDIEDVEFRADESQDLPSDIKWMLKKKQLVFKGSDLHNTSFIRDIEYHKYLEFWGLEASFDYIIDGTKGICTVSFGFKDFITKGDRAEFEINIAQLVPDKTQLIKKEKNALKRELLDKLEDRKNQIYKEFLERKTAMQDAPVA